MVAIGCSGEVGNKKPRVFAGLFLSGRRDRIRTCDPLLPKQMRYQAALLPDSMAGPDDLRRTAFGDGGPGRIRTRDLAVMSGQL